jgi:hypothetical protein
LSGISPADIINNSEAQASIAPEETKRIWAKRMFGQRRPKDLYVPRIYNEQKQKFASISYDKWIDGSEVAVVHSPYSLQQNRMFEACWRGDETFRRGVNLVVKFAFGRRTKTSVDVTEEFSPTPTGTTEKGEKVADELSNREASQLKTFVDNVNRRVKFHQKAKAAIHQSLVGGRSALRKEYDAQGVPSELKVLNWMKLGDVFVDPETWEFLGVSYQDSFDPITKEPKPLLAEEIIYLPWMDFNMTPDSQWHGTSVAETCAHVSEQNRLINQVDLKEITRSMWAPYTIISVDPDTPEDQADQILQDFYPGTVNMTSSDVVVDVKPQAVDIQGLINLRDQNRKTIAAAIGVPNMLIGFEDVTNRATTTSVLTSWHDSELDDFRTWLQDCFEPQWFDPLTDFFFEFKQRSSPLRQEQIDQDKPPSKLSPQFVVDDLLTERRKYKVKLEFEDITFETFKEKSEGLNPMYDRHLLTEEKYLEIMNMPDQVNEILARKEQQRLIDEQNQQIQLQLQQRAIDARAQGAFAQAGGGRFGNNAKKPFPQKTAAVQEVVVPAPIKSATQEKLEQEELNLRIQLRRRQLQLVDAIENNVNRTLKEAS